MTALTIYIDFKSPASYLAFKPTMQLLGEFEAEPRWLPYRTNQHPLPTARADETKGETHIRVRERARRDMHEKYATIQGIPLNFRDDPGQTDIALAALLHVSGDPTAFIAAAFRAYWVENLDLNDATVVTGLLNQNGYDVSGFDQHALLDELDSQQISAEELGVVDAPAFVLGGQVFIGREHMPWLRELLSA
jgi:2-hydroxychromene-2-carboxylate isomerase